MKTIYFFFGILTAMVGWNIHHNVFFTIADFLLWPIALAWWLLSHDLTISVIQQTFYFFNH